MFENHGVVIHSAYGSAKDISVYTQIGLKPKEIFIVGKASKKQQQQATVLTEGYAAHLSILMSHGGSRPAQGNARMVIPRGYFGLPGQPFSRRRSSEYVRNLFVNFLNKPKNVHGKIPVIKSCTEIYFMLLLEIIIRVLIFSTVYSEDIQKKCKALETFELVISR
nr:unnamed protein product [Callosobruchus chinensis]